MEQRTYRICGMHAVLVVLVALAGCENPSDTGIQYIDISSREQFENIANQLSGTYRLTADIDLGGVEFTPLGSASEPFTGTLEGNNKTIRDLSIQQVSSDSIGLFAYTAEGTQGPAKIQNLTLEDPDVRGNISVGALAGNAAHTTIDNVHVVNGTVNAYQRVGQIVGTLKNGTLFRCSSSGGSATSSDIIAGGLVGTLGDDSEISECTSSASVSAGSRVGGLIGVIEEIDTNNKIIVTNSYATGAVNLTDAQRMGGLVGLADAVAEILYNYSTSSISGGSAAIGALVGETASSVQLLDNRYQSGSGLSAVGIHNGTGSSTGLVQTSITQGDFSSWTFGSTWRWVSDGQWPNLTWE